MEAARIDGASEVGIFLRVILPLLGPALATLGILTFLGSWNNFLWPSWWPRPTTPTRSRWRSRSTPPARTRPSTAS
ncbi:ABC transporter permease subunit [Tessaracoccus coleopterorum]|uniref:ABC transporter permease subunit n=1 Tax=Tessaracoccus coleopterorum TaxID=2714950 RepID=UPI002F90E666